MTNVKPSQLNYDRYSDDKYDLDIINSIPFHKEIHQEIVDFVKKNFSDKKEYNLLDLGVGTGITSQLVQEVLSNSQLEVVDFSKQMLAGAKKKLGKDKVKYITTDYSKYDFPKIHYDLIFSVIGLHHQNEKDDFSGSKKIFKKIYKILKPGGVFILGDLVTYKDKRKASLNHAKHYAHLVEHSTDEKTLEEWSYHHMYLNNLVPIEDLIKWLEQTGFKVTKKFLKVNTALLVCKKLNK